MENAPERRRGKLRLVHSVRTPEDPDYRTDRKPLAEQPIGNYELGLAAYAWAGAILHRSSSEIENGVEPNAYVSRSWTPADKQPLETRAGRLALSGEIRRYTGTPPSLPGLPPGHHIGPNAHVLHCYDAEGIETEQYIMRPNLHSPTLHFDGTQYRFVPEDPNAPEWQVINRALQAIEAALNP